MRLAIFLLPLNLSYFFISISTFGNYWWAAGYCIGSRSNQGAKKLFSIYFHPVSTIYILSPPHTHETAFTSSLRRALFSVNFSLKKMCACWILIRYNLAGFLLFCFYYFFHRPMCLVGICFILCADWLTCTCLYIYSWPRQTDSVLAVDKRTVVGTETWSSLCRKKEKK